jgi:hypothetical protein
MSREIFFAAAVSIPALVCYAAEANDPKPEELNAKAVTWVEANIKDKLAKNADIVKAVEAANTARANWKGYSAEWEKWSPEEAEKNKDSYSYIEWLYSFKKDKKLREELTTGAAAEALKAAVKDSGGFVTRTYVLDAKGCNVAADVATTDYFQGDEGKWTEVEKTKKVCAGEAPYRDKSTGVFAAQISVPIFNDKNELIGAAIVVIATDKLK